jgi:hypothetical protein
LCFLNGVSPLLSILMGIGIHAVVYYCWIPTFVGMGTEYSNEVLETPHRKLYHSAIPQPSRCVKIKVR